MKKSLIFISTIFVFTIVSFVLFVDADPLLDYKEALELGEEKYLEFLWIIDGAFNDTRYNYTYSVNGKELSNDNKKFTCTYKNNKCISSKFEEYFNNLFYHTIKLDNVYGDGASFSWYKKGNNNYSFTNINTCNVTRMDKNHKLEVISIKKGMVTYKVTFSDKIIGKIGYKQYNKHFALKYENKKWKVYRAYYHDLCGMDYNIE